MFEENIHAQELIIEEGDSIEIIADAFNTTPDAIKAENPEINLSQLTPEQNLQIPFPPRQCSSGNIYIIRRGDTLAGIARQFGVSEQAILRENPFLVVLGIRAGLQICIPAPQPTICPGGFFYTVVAGDTLFNIAARFNTSIGAIIQANPGLTPNRLFVGQQICIPGQRPPVCPGGFFYTIVAGDTLFSIATRFNTTAVAILQANPGLDPNRLFVGQRICIPVPQPTPCTGGFFYTVVAGDTIFSIAARFGTTVNAILQANPGLDPNRLFVGQRICIPVPQPTPCTGGFFYTVVAGDTIFSIAARFGTTVNAILQANPGLDPNRLFVGQRICIPVPQPTPCTGGFFYTIIAGDTLFSIATRFNTTVNALLQANPGLDPNRLFVGQRICIPVAPPPPCQGIFYTVVVGDTLNSIAARFNTTVPAILQANPGLDPNFIVIGQRICIPASPPTPTCTGFTYTIVAGDTLIAIASRFNTTVDAILRANPGLNPNQLFIGQQLCIPR